MTLAVVLVVGVAVLIAAAIVQKGVPEFVLLAVVLAVISLAYAGDYWGTKRAPSEALLRVKSDPVASGRVPLPLLFLQTIPGLPRPLRIALRLVAKVAIFFGAVVMIVPGTIVCTAVKIILAGLLEVCVLYPLIPILIVVIGVVSFAFRRETKELTRLRDGEVASARVIAEEAIARGKHSYNQNTYEFHVSGGPLILKTEKDPTNEIFEDMQIPVFYDPVCPNHCAVQCETYYWLRDAEL